VCLKKERKIQEPKKDAKKTKKDAKKTLDNGRPR
jgi:hypothetical protein